MTNFVNLDILTFTDHKSEFIILEKSLEKRMLVDATMNLKSYRFYIHTNNNLHHRCIFCHSIQHLWGPSLMSPKIFSGHILLFHSYQVSRVEEAFLQGIFTLFNLDQLFKTRLACKWDFAWKHKRNNSEQQWNIFGDYTNHMGSDFSQIFETIHFIYTNIFPVCPTHESFS